MRRTYDLFICEVCGHSRQRPGMCPFCKIELVRDEDVREIEMSTASRTERILDNHRWYI
jgi:hypothetical protein